MLQISKTKDITDHLHIPNCLGNALIKDLVCDLRYGKDFKIWQRFFERKL